MAEYLVIRTDENGNFDPQTVIRGLKDKARVALNAVGSLLVDASQEAFQEQAFGDFEWPERYPDAPEPFINVAGALADFNAGASQPKARRFDRRPALFDTGNLAGSISYRVVGEDSVEVGSTLDYASEHQWGTVSTMPVTLTAKQGIARWLQTDEGRPFTRKFLLMLNPNVTSWMTEVVQRPFVGTTDEIEEDIAATIQEVMTGAV